MTAIIDGIWSLGVHGFETWKRCLILDSKGNDDYSFTRPTSGRDDSLCNSKPKIAYTVTGITVTCSTGVEIGPLV
jgi:hypothetical protein